jgi:hypothetical protein
LAADDEEGAGDATDVDEEGAGDEGPYALMQEPPEDWGSILKTHAEDSSHIRLPSRAWGVLNVLLACV